MNAKEIMQIFQDTAYVRTGGSPEELRCAEYFVKKCASLGLTARIEPFPVDMADVEEAVLTVDGREIPCRGYLCSGSGEVEAPFYYLTGTDKLSLSRCAGKIVLLDGYLGCWTYRDLVDSGALAFITYGGSVTAPDRDIDRRELRSYISQGRKLPGVHINVKDATAIVAGDPQTARIVLRQTEYQGESRNVVLELPGQIPDTIVFSAHYDSTFLSQGAYDNMSGSIGILGIAEHFAAHPHRHTLRFVWCGSEERGLLGAKAHCAEEENLKNVVLNINLDMIGSVMGKFIACCTSEEKLVHYIEYFGSEAGFGISARQGVYSSDSTPFADKGIPAISFARQAPGGTAPIHVRYDTMDLVKGERMEEDIAFLISFSERMANAYTCPVAKEMPDNMKEKLDIYLCRKRDKK